MQIAHPEKRNQPYAKSCRAPPSVNDLWQSLPEPQRHRLISILSQMLENHLNTVLETEVQHESPS